MKHLDGTGYDIRISQWVGQFGNHLCQLSNAVNIALKTRSRLTFPAHEIIKDHVFDFTDGWRVRRPQVRGVFFWQNDCFQFPIVYDLDRRAILQKYVSPLIYDPAFVNNDVGDDTLVVNIRSGDIFLYAGDSAVAIQSGMRYYPQPPLAMYKLVIEHFGYRDVLVVTQPDMRNPCIKGLMDCVESVRLKHHRGASDDFHTLLSARHLVTAHSSFSWCAALMSDRLDTLHQPETFVIRGVPDYSIHTYGFSNYIDYDKWEPSAQNLSLMLNLPTDQVNIRSAPKREGFNRDTLEASAFGVGDYSSAVEIESGVPMLLAKYWAHFKAKVRPRARLRALLQSWR